MWNFGFFRVKKFWTNIRNVLYMVVVMDYFGFLVVLLLNCCVTCPDPKFTCGGVEEDKSLAFETKLRTKTE